MLLSDLPVPDTAAARLAREVCGHFHSPALVNHCERSYRFAAALGVAEELIFDPELLYVASMLHDSGLTEPFDNVSRPFEHAGGDVGWVFAAGAGWRVARRNRVSEIIVRHMWRSVDPKLDVEGYLLESATSLDISGSRAESWPLELRAEVIRQYPRLELSVEFGRCFADQAARKPDSNAARSVESGLLSALAGNPLEQLG
ncbi:MAG TPA: hypothetical protein VHO01_09155 [Jatrophihabitans sp.]|nr:hypothetical protein [Jatrophihabitans sp.]